MFCFFFFFFYSICSFSLLLYPGLFFKKSFLSTLLLLVEISMHIEKLVKLETISLSSNLLPTFHLPNGGKMKNLKRVDLSSNKLKNFPVDLCTLPNVDAVDLSKNLITHLPKDVSSLKAIELNLNRNHLKYLNDALCECGRLKVLRVEENCLSLDSFTERLLKHSNISLIAFDGNTFNMKQFQDVDGYDEV